MQPESAIARSIADAALMDRVRALLREIDALAGRDEVFTISSSQE